MKHEDLKKLLIEFAELLELYGAENLTNGIEMYADEFARRQVKLFCQPDVIGSLHENKCKYCGVMTTQPDEECYKAPTGNDL